MLLYLGAVLAGCSTAIDAQQEVTPSPDRSSIATSEEGLAATATRLESKEGGAERLRGHLVWGHEMRSFTECETGRTAWVYELAGVDLGEVTEGFGNELYQPLFVELVGKWMPGSADGFAADFNETLSVQSLLRAEREGFGCKENLENIVYRARGNEPSWKLDLRNDSLSLARFGSDEILWSAPEVATKEGGLVITGESGKEVIEVVIAAGHCTDTMSGSVYAFTTTITMAGQHFSGCAVAGPDTEYPVIR